MFTFYATSGKVARVGFLLLLICGALTFNQTKACDRTSFTLDSIVQEGGEYDIYTTMRIGGGITGTQKGADDQTDVFGFGFFSCNPNFQITGFTPVLIADTTQTPSYGVNMGPGFFGTQGFIFYQTWGVYTCINNTAFCGHVHTDITEVVFRVPVLPDSILAYGFEASGSPFQGCFGQPDMAIRFGALADDCSGTRMAPQQGPAMAASVVQNMHPFMAQGYDPAAAESALETHLDKDPSQDLLIYPNPNNGNFRIHAQGMIEGDTELIVFDLAGKEIDRRTVSGTRQVELNLNHLEPGMYMLKMEGPKGELVRRFQVAK